MNKHIQQGISIEKSYIPMKRMKELLHLFTPGDGVHISEAGNRYVALELLKQL